MLNVEFVKALKYEFGSQMSAYGGQLASNRTYRGTSRFNASGWTLDCPISDLKRKNGSLASPRNHYCRSRPSMEDNLDVQSPRD